MRFRCRAPFHYQRQGSGGKCSAAPKMPALSALKLAVKLSKRGLSQAGAPCPALTTTKRDHSTEWLASPEPWVSINSAEQETEVSGASILSSSENCFLGPLKIGNGMGRVNNEKKLCIKIGHSLSRREKP